MSHFVVEWDTYTAHYTTPWRITMMPSRDDLLGRQVPFLIYCMLMDQGWENVPVVVPMPPQPNLDEWERFLDTLSIRELEVVAIGEASEAAAILKYYPLLNRWLEWVFQTYLPTLVDNMEADEPELPKPYDFAVLN